MHRLITTPLTTHRGVRVSASDDGLPLSNHGFFELLGTASFAQQFSQLINSLPYRAVFWEMPAFNAQNRHEPFECVLLAAPKLRGLTANKRPFRRWLQSIPHDQSTHFPNLAGNAELISPRGHVNDAFAHLKSFCLHASPIQITHFWKTVSERVLANMDARPIWVSTSGLGVSWLHVRLDSRPKYYRYQPYQAGYDKGETVLEHRFG